jgi:hypothetical protein
MAKKGEKIKGILIYKEIKLTPNKQICVHCEERIKQGEQRIHIPLSSFSGRVNFRAVHRPCFKKIIINGDLIDL